MRSNPVKHALASGKTVIGSEISRIRSTDIPRLFAAGGFDFVFIDTEHSPLGFETVSDLVAMARATGIVPIVRVTQAEYPLVARTLDVGAQGIIIPRVNTAAEVREIVSWMKFPPFGVRGFADTFAQTEGTRVTAQEFVEAGNSENLCVIQIERREAVENVEEMLAVPGVDVACMGCMDLSVDLGVPGELDHPAMVESMNRVLAAAHKHNVAVGIISGRFDIVSRWMQAGMRFVSFGTETMLLQEVCTATVNRLRAVSQ
ncbi:MAG: aldolase [Planctomycetes bacterium]|nr:aldolase [Planctomycetota bacterium]